MGRAVNESRRRFLKISAAAGGGMIVGFHVAACGRREPVESAAKDRFAPNAWIRIGADDVITLVTASSEMGQGVMTAVPMLLAEELEADWRKVRVESAPVDKAYVNPIIGQQLTGGSTTVRAFWSPLRQAGAIAREMLIAAAALTWGVAESECRAVQGSVVHKASGRSLRYGELAEKAATLTPPQTAFLKDPAEFRLLGRKTPRVDTPDKVNGRAVFGLDVRLPGMLIATVERCPVFGGKLKRLDAEVAKKSKGVRAVVEIESGVAVVAEDFWSAKRGRDALVVEWNEGEGADLSDALIRREFVQALAHASPVRREGDAAAAVKRAHKVLKANYEVPFLAHGCMEPMNATADVRADACDVWVPTQAQGFAQHTAARIARLPAEKVRVHTTFLGGGFGRRAEQDFVAEAVELSRRVGKPVKVVWTREDDVRHDYYRPATQNQLAAALDRNGRLIGWRHDIAGPSIMARVMPQMAPAVAPEWLPKGVKKVAAKIAGIVAEHRLDETSVEGAKNLPYEIPNLEVRYAMVNTPVPVGFWRSVGNSQNIFVTECFIDEIARVAGRDPLAFRSELLAGHPRHRAVLDLAAEKAGWGKPLPKGRSRGIAVAESFGSWVAQVAEVSIDGGRVRVHRVVCAVDCGLTVNPDTVEAQMESGIVFGLTAALKGEINIERGRVKQSNFHDYPMLRMDEMPVIEVHIVRSEEPPGGVGEPGTPPIAPAVANAVFAATGRPVRRLPIRL